MLVTVAQTIIRMSAALRPATLARVCRDERVELPMSEAEY